MRIRLLCLSAVTLVALAVVVRKLPADGPQNLLLFRNSSGVSQTITTNGTIDPNNAFFQNLGTNGRTCATCHQADQGWTVTPEKIRERFVTTAGTDPIFRPVDGATCPTADVSTVRARVSAYRLLLTKGLIRIDRPMPPNAEFTILSIDDPYNCSGVNDISVYRRPLPATNLSFLSTVMWDGRETVPGQMVTADLISQALDATTGHAQGQPPTQAQLNSIVQFEIALFTAQIRDNKAGRLDVDGAAGGPANLSQQEFFIGINDPLGLNPKGTPFDPEAFTIFKQWQQGFDEDKDQTLAKQSIQRGEQIFNNRIIHITGVAGLNDKLGIADIPGTCTTCHDSPNVGDHSVVAPLNVGVSDESRRTPDLPLFTIQCNTTGQIIKTTDPGRAMVSGKCSDLGKFKGPVLRGLASRAPYFHNGSAATLLDAVNFYDTRFNLGLTDQDKADLVAFLQSL
jgi:cytochrome c peroxidase